MSDTDYFGPDLLLAAGELVDDELLLARDGRWHLRPDVSYPAQDVNVRSMSSHFYTLVEQESGVILETVDEMSAFLQLHPGAVYLHGGEPYLIADLDLESHTAYGAVTEAPYFTQVLDYTETRVLDVFRERPAAGTVVYLGRVNVSTTVVGFKRIAHFSEEVLGEEYVSLPRRDFDTVALWFDVPKDTLEYIRAERLDLAGGLHAVEHAAIGVLPLFALCDRNDIGGISTPLHPDTNRPQVFIHDGHPGGVGIAEHGFEVVEELWKATLSVIAGCPCETGCPGCIQSPKCGSNNKPLDKAVAEIILRDIMGPSSRT
jgi:DEAD/DEAH box helicase domain-containing protein